MSDDATTSGSVDPELPTTASPASRELESRYLGPWSEDDVDPELEGLGTTEKGPGGLQPLVLLLIAALGTLVAWTSLPDLIYSFQSSEPIALGRANDLVNSEWMVDGALQLPSDRLVSLSGIPGERSVAPPRYFYKLTGSSIYMERSGDDGSIATTTGLVRGEIDPSDFASPTPPTATGSTIPLGTADSAGIRIRNYWEGQGRLIAFEDLPQRYQTVVEYYSQNYGRHFCGFEPMPQIRRILDAERVAAEQALEDRLGRIATPEEFVAEYGHRFECQRGYLLIQDATPASYWYLRYLYAAWVVVMGGVAWFLVQWVRASRA